MLLEGLQPEFGFALDDDLIPQSDGAPPYRMMVFPNWVWAYFTYGLGARLIIGRRRRGRM